ncbi:DUF443 family protein [Terribacillus saccharophilus]|uniref:DUF443 family protein n=1 Tax=Terribacillus saccharophilus TaxID=361277 RepID=UPI0039822E95
MRGEIRRLKGNLRYRILNINEDYYLIDTGSSPWKAIFPFLFLIFRNPGYKIDEETALQLLTNQKTQMRKFAIYGFMAGGLSISLSGILMPLTNRLNIDSTFSINIIITFILVSMFIMGFLFLLRVLKQNVEKTISYTDLPKHQIKIYSPKISHILKIQFFSLFFAAFSVTFLIAFINYSNIFILFMGLVSLILFLLYGGLGLDHGKYKIKF